MDKRIISFSLFLFSAVFFITAWVVVRHQHDLSYRFSTCSLCKIKSGLSAAVKSKMDNPQPLAVTGICLSRVTALPSGTITDIHKNRPTVYEFLSFAHRAPPAAFGIL